MKVLYCTHHGTADYPAPMRRIWGWWGHVGGDNSLVHSWGFVRFVVGPMLVTYIFVCEEKALPFGGVFRAPVSSSFWLVPHHQNALLRLKGECALGTIELWQLISPLAVLAASNGKRLASSITPSFDEYLSIFENIILRWNGQ